jgi:sugar phosphate isomerase/epimerase
LKECAVTNPSRLNRREFLQAGALGATLAVTWSSTPRAAAPPRWKVIAFSKPFTHLSFDDTADLVADVGWDGIECPVRKTSTHIDPERVEEQLPKMVEALKKRGREVSMITTDITGVSKPAELILRTAARLGIRRYRLGALHYVANRPIPDQLEEFKARIRDLVQLNHSLGIQGGIQNHSGQDYFGAPVWDAYEVIRGLPPGDIGIAFDIGHATLEGGLSWPIQARLAEPRYSVVYVKDFRWEKQAGAWKPVWCALGDGMVSGKFFHSLAASKFAGPVCQHHEYEIGTTPAEHIRHFKEDLKILRTWLSESA